MPNDIQAKLVIQTAEGVANIKTLGDATDANMARIARAIEANNKQLAAYNRSLKEAAAAQKAAGDAASGIDKATAAGKQAAAAIGEVEKGVHSLGLANAGFVREMAVLFHEGVTGNFKRALGSTIVLGERSGYLTQIMRGLVGPVGAAAAAVGVFAVAAEEGYRSSEDFRKAMILTGGAAGVTEGQFRAMAQTIAAETGRSVGSAKEALQALVASGEVAPQNLAKMGTAIVQIAHLTGESSAEVAKQFDDMASDVVGWIQRHKQYADSLTASQVEAIRQLQRSGDIQGAVGIALDSINAKTADSAGFWAKLGNAASSAWEKIGHFIGGATTPEETLAALDSQIATIEARLTRIKSHPEEGSIFDQGDAQNLPALRQQRAAVAANLAAQQQAAAQKGVEQATQNAGKAARAHLDAMLDEAKGAGALKEALARLHAEIDTANKAGGKATVSAEEQRELEQKVIKAHRDPNDKKQENAYASTLKSLTDEKAKLDALTESYTRYGRAVDDSREAVLRARFGDKADALFGKASTSEGRALMGAATATDQSDRASKEAERLAAVQRQVKAYLELTDAKEQSAKATYIQQALDSVGLSASQQTTQSLVVQAEQVKAAAAARFATSQTQRETQDLRDREVSINAEVEAINRQNDSLHQTALERAIATDAAKLQKAAEDELAKPYADQVAIQAQLADGIARVTAARTKQYNDARDPQTQAKAAAGNWAAGATDAGAAAAKMTTSSLDDISNAIEKMTRTGKFNFKDLWKTMADEFLSQVIRMQVAKLATGAGGLWGSVFSALTSSGGASSPDADGGSVNLFADAIDGARATGGNVNAGGSYIVGEKGPELFKASGSGTIIPNDQIGGGSGGMTVHVGQGQVINVGQGVSRAEVQQAVTRANSATIKQVQRLASTGRLRTT